MIPNNEIWYTSTDGNIVTWGSGYDKPTGNTYTDGKGVMVWSSDLTQIGGWGFSNAQTLQTIILPSTITGIGEYSFDKTYALTSITFYNTTPPSVGNNAFLRTSSNCIIYCPAGCVSSYTTWKNNIIQLANWTVSSLQTATAMTVSNVVWATDIAGTGGTGDSGNCSYTAVVEYDDGTSETNPSALQISGEITAATNPSHLRRDVGELNLTFSIDSLSYQTSVEAYQEGFFRYTIPYNNMYSGSTNLVSVEKGFNQFNRGGNPINMMCKNGRIIYQNIEPHNFGKDYLTFRVNGAGNVSRESVNMTAPNMEYSLNGGNWTSFASSVSVVQGDTIRFRGSNLNYATSDSAYTRFTSTANFDVEGNIMSLVYGDNFVGNRELASAFTFTKLFVSATTIQSAQNLVLPATSLTEGCYREMFGYSSIGCAPSLPATTLAIDCYRGMFYNCHGLSVAPTKLPATTLAERCYYYMFRETAISEAPAFTANTLAPSCCKYMFKSCYNLTSAPALPATALTQSCYSNMFEGCISLTTAPSLPATSLTQQCYEAMFTGCTSLTTAPDLPAETLVDRCYQNMFKGCSSLNYIKCLATDKSANKCTNTWVQNVSASGTFVRASGVSWDTGNSGVPLGWTIE